MLGNSFVTKSQNVALKPSSRGSSQRRKEYRMLATRELVFVFSILAAGMIVAPVFALKVTEPTAASHGYPGLCDMNGKKLANGEFRQWVDDDWLHVGYHLQIFRRPSL